MTSVLNVAVTHVPQSEQVAVRDLREQSAAMSALAAGRLALAKSPYGPLRSLSCDLVDEAVILQGRVPTYYLKQLALSSVHRAVKPWHVRDEVQVRESAHASR